MLENAVAGREEMRRAKAIARMTVPPIAGTVALIGLWWLAVIVFDIAPILLPSPPEVAEAFRGKQDFLLEETWVTTKEAVFGFGLAVAGGLLIGLAIASSQLVERSMYPVLIGLNGIPKAAFAPLLLVWMGFGPESKVVMALLFCFFPVALATATGLTSTPTELADLTRSLSANRLQSFIKVRFPAAAPQIFVGLKIALPLAVIGAVIGELQGASEGLGYVVVQASAFADTALAFSAIALLGAVSVVLFYLLVGLESLALPWARATTSQR
jgi:NitT/TauT family transport system permease protein